MGIEERAREPSIGVMLGFLKSVELPLLLELGVADGLSRTSRRNCVLFMALSVGSCQA